MGAASRRPAHRCADVPLPALGPVFLTAGLFGVSVLGAQAPLSTFARTDPEVYGYGLGTTGFATSLIIGLYLIAMIVGALSFTHRPTSDAACDPDRRRDARRRRVPPVRAVPRHLRPARHEHDDRRARSGALVAALPAAAASAAPPTQTGVATGLTNSVKTVGGAIASCVFGIALLHGATGAVQTGGTAGSLSGYMTVWIVCGVTALTAAVLLVFVPKQAFTDRAEDAVAEAPAVR